MNCRIIRATAIGDAYGAGYEYAPQREVEEFSIGDGFKQHAKYVEILPGMFTDDTMLSVAAASALLDDWARKVNPAQATFCERMVNLHRERPTKGYSKHMLEALDLGAKDGPEAFAHFFDETFRSESNGAAMRSAVYGVLGHLFEATDSAAICARVTHTGLGVEGAQVVAAASHFFVRGLGKKHELNDFLSRSVSPIWTTRIRERVAKQNGPITFLTVAGALTVIRESTTLSQVIERSIHLGGDVDTVAAIAMGIAVSCPEIEDDLPAGLWRGEGILPVGGLPWDALAELDESLDRVIDGYAE